MTIRVLKLQHISAAVAFLALCSLVYDSYKVESSTDDSRQLQELRSIVHVYTHDQTVSKRAPSNVLFEDGTLLVRRRARTPVCNYFFNQTQHKIPVKRLHYHFWDCTEGKPATSYLSQTFGHTGLLLTAMFICDILIRPTWK